MVCTDLHVFHIIHTLRDTAHRKATGDTRDPLLRGSEGCRRIFKLHIFTDAKKTDLDVCANQQLESDKQKPDCAYKNADNNFQFIFDQVSKPQDLVRGLSLGIYLTKVGHSVSFK